MTTDVLERDPRLIVQEQGLRGMGRAFVTRIRNGELGSLPVIIGLILIWAIFQADTGNFISPSNLNNLAVDISYGGLISLGIVMVLLLGEIDLSVGSMSGLCAAITAVLNVQHGWNPWLAILVAVLAGAALGAFQGFVFSAFTVPSFVVTLAGLLAFLGLQLKVLGKTGTINFPFGGTISNLTNYHFSDAIGYLFAIIGVVLFALSMAAKALQQRRAGLPAQPWTVIAAGTLGVAIVLFVSVWELNRSLGVPLALVIFLGFVLLFAVITTRTQYGRHVFAVGGNIEAARRAGVQTRMVQITVFSIAGAMAAIGGVMSASYVDSASQSTGGSDLLLYTIAAAVIGGTSLFGGRGSAWSALLGWLVIGSIYQGMFLIGLQSDAQYLVIGGVLLAAAIIDALSRRGRAGRGRA
ncbi:MAG TPA: sugar ABC transporter permease [Mycobacteriales bacterium]|nr:sugar ABC transporter permease [Mycobacteriales bacterium]